MEAVVALGIPEVAPLLAAWAALVNLTSTSAIGIRLVAVGSIITETSVMRALLPADWTNSGVAILAVVEAKSSVLLFTSGAVRQRLSSGTSGRFHPA